MTKKIDEKKKVHRLLRTFNITGLIHTLITISTVVMVILFVVTINWRCIIAMEVLSTVTWFNSVIWVVCAIMLVVKAKKLNNPDSVAHTRRILIAALLLILLPDTLIMALWFTPLPKDNYLVSIISLASPICGFIGWFIGTSIGRKIKKNEK